MKRWFWMAVLIGLWLLATPAAALAGQTPPETPWLKLYVVLPGTTYDCATLAATRTPVYTLTMGTCYDSEVIIAGNPPGDAWGMKLCTPDNEVGNPTGAFVSYDAHTESTIFHEATVDMSHFGNTWNDFVEYRTIELLDYVIGKPVTLLPADEPELMIGVETYDQYESGTLYYYSRLCAGWIGADDPTTSAVTLTDYGALGQIVDIDLGLDIVEKLVGYIGAANIRDYIALAFALAAVLALFKAPSQ